MSRDYFIIAIVVLLAVVLVIVVVRKNKKDLLEFEQKLNRDYHHPTAAEHTNDPESTKSAL